MFEYASVSASAYDVDSLVGKLNDHAALGWQLKSVVAAGGDVVAIMQRVAGEHSSSDSAAASSTESSVSVPEVSVPDVSPPVVEEVTSVVGDAASSAHNAASSVVGGVGAAATTAAAGFGLGSVFGHDTPSVGNVVAEVPSVEVPSVEIPSINVPAIDVASVAVPAVEVPAVIVEAAPVVAEAIEPTGWGSAQTTVATPVAPAPVPTPAPQPVVVTPAGWYPDPSGRYEMRYWDGLAWTEHVSRQGQQFTDPPVA